jgi:hypothetical protein
MLKYEPRLIIYSTAMFEAKENPGYERLSQDATGLIKGWLQNDWYRTSSDPKGLIEQAA